MTHKAGTFKSKGYYIGCDICKKEMDSDTNGIYYCWRCENEAWVDG